MTAPEFLVAVDVVDCALRRVRMLQQPGDIDILDDAVIRRARDEEVVLRHRNRWLSPVDSTALRTRPWDEFLEDLVEPWSAHGANLFDDPIQDQGPKRVKFTKELRLAEQRKPSAKRVFQFDV